MSKFVDILEKKHMHMCLKNVDVLSFVKAFAAQPWCSCSFVTSESMTKLWLATQPLIVPDPMQVSHASFRSFQHAKCLAQAKECFLTPEKPQLFLLRWLPFCSFVSHN